MAKIKTVFERLKELYGSDDAIAAKFNMTRTNAIAWKNNGIPSNRALEIEKKTRGVITAMDVLRG